MADLMERVTTKVGPLPAWAWAAIPAAAYVAWSYYKASQGTATGATDAIDGASTDQSALDYGINSGSGYLPGYGSAPYGSSNLPQVDTPKFDNLAWFRQAVNYLIGEGFTTTDIVTGLNAYLYGAPEEINSQQMSALQKALLRFGAAPEPAFVPKATDELHLWPGGVRGATNLQVTPGRTSAVFSWTASPNGTRYNVYVKEGVSYLWNYSTRATSVNMASGLEPGHVYSLEVQTGNDNNQWSPEIARATFTTTT